MTFCESGNYYINYQPNVGSGYAAVRSGSKIISQLSSLMSLCLTKCSKEPPEGVRVLGSAPSFRRRNTETE